MRPEPDRQGHRRLRLTVHKKREVLLHLSREKKIELPERIYNEHLRPPFAEPLVVATSKCTQHSGGRRLYEINYSSIWQLLGDH